MTTYRYQVANGSLDANTRYRIDTASGSNTPATITSVGQGTTIAGSIVTSDNFGGGPVFNGTASTLYAKALNLDGSLQGASPVTLTAAATLNDAAGPAQRGVVTLTGQSGTVALDLSLGTIFVVNLTGNVTGWSFSNPASSAQDITVHFVQDATGSRTLAGANASIKLAGGSLTLTTTASKRDVLRLQQISGTYYELSRSLNQ